MAMRRGSSGPAVSLLVLGLAAGGARPLPLVAVVVLGAKLVVAGAVLVAHYAMVGLAALMHAKLVVMALKLGKVHSQLRIFKKAIAAEETVRASFSRLSRLRAQACLDLAATRWFSLAWAAVQATQSDTNAELLPQVTGPVDAAFAGLEKLTHSATGFVAFHMRVSRVAILSDALSDEVVELEKSAVGELGSDVLAEAEKAVEKEVGLKPFIVWLAKKLYSRVKQSAAAVKYSKALVNQVKAAAKDIIDGVNQFTDFLKTAQEGLIRELVASYASRESAADGPQAVGDEDSGKATGATSTSLNCEMSLMFVSTPGGVLIYNLEEGEGPESLLEAYDVRGEQLIDFDRRNLVYTFANNAGLAKEFGSSLGRKIMNTVIAKYKKSASFLSEADIEKALKARPGFQEYVLFLFFRTIVLRQQIMVI